MRRPVLALALLPLLVAARPAHREPVWRAAVLVELQAPDAILADSTQAHALCALAIRRIFAALNAAPVIPAPRALCRAWPADSAGAIRAAPVWRAGGG